MDYIRLLLVADHAAFRRSAADFLHRHDDLLVVGVAGDGREALKQAAGLQPDVILLDLHLPDRDGLQALPHLRALLPEAHVIVLALFDYAAYRQAALAAGAADFVAKSEFCTSLVPAIRQIAQSLAPERTRNADTR